MTNVDPTLDAGRWDRLFGVLRRIDSEIERLYESAGQPRMRSRFALPLLRIAHAGPSTISALAHATGQTHSAMSQTIDAMKRGGFVRSRPGGDARTRVVELTESGTALVPLVEREWRATEATVAELDDALSVSLVDIAAELEAQLSARGVAERFAAHLADTHLPDTHLPDAAAAPRE